MSPNRANESEWQPAWTVVTTPPNFAERWALGKARSFQDGGNVLQIVWVAYCALTAFDTWNKGQTGRMTFAIVMIAFAAYSAWEHYAFGLLLGREAELRDIQTRR